MAVHKVQKFICIVDESGNPIGLGGASGMFVQGPVADGAAVTGNPVLVGGQDGTNVQSILTDTTGRTVVVGAAAAGAAVAGNPLYIGLQNTSGNAVGLKTASNTELFSGIAVASIDSYLPAVMMGRRGGGTTYRCLATHGGGGDTNDGNNVLSAGLYALNSAASYDQIRTANAADGTTGTGLLGAGCMVFDGTNWQQMASNTSGQIANTPVIATANNLDAQGHSLGVLTSSAGVNRALVIVPYISNGTNFDRMKTVTGSAGMVAVGTSFSFNRITTNTTTTIKSGVGSLGKIVVQTAGASSNTVTIYDNTAGSGTIIAIYTNMAVGTYEFDLAFGTGLTVVTATGTAPTMTFTYI